MPRAKIQPRCCFLGKPTSRFGKQYFVHMNDESIGGRWFERDITKQPDGSYQAVSHDGGKGTYGPLAISKAGLKSEVGDSVLSYFKGGRNYAFSGTHGATNGSKILVHYADGDKAWEDQSTVHKLVTLYSLVFEPSCKSNLIYLFDHYFEKFHSIAANYADMQKSYCKMSLADKRKFLEGDKTNPSDVENLLATVRYK